MEVPGGQLCPGGGFAVRDGLLDPRVVTVFPPGPEHRGDVVGEERVATRGGHVGGVIFHADRGSQYTSAAFTQVCDLRSVRDPQEHGAGICRLRAGGEGRWNDHRRVLSGIVSRIRAAVPWRDLPECYGSW